MEAGVVAMKIDEARNTGKVIDLTETWNKFDNLLTDINEYSELTFELESSTSDLGGISSAKKQLQLDLAQDSSPWTVIRPPTFLAARIYPSYKEDLSKSLLTRRCTWQKSVTLRAYMLKRDPEN